MKTFLLAASFLALLSTCESCPPPDIPTAPDGGSIPVTDVKVFEAACKKFEELKCQSPDGRNLWDPTPGGVSCPEVFKNAADNGVNLHPECIQNIKTCDERHACTDEG